MSDYAALYAELEPLGAQRWLQTLPAQVEQALSPSAHRELSTWQAVVAQLPDFSTNTRILNRSAPQIGTATELSEAAQQRLHSSLQQLIPWRKGPFELFGIYIDTEWRSDWKWQRLAPHISPLEQRLVLDVGCGNGYHAWRMLGAGAKLVIGLDPLLLNVWQFAAVKKLHGPAPIYVLPLGIETLPHSLMLFDTVFSMGVFYHRRSPMDHLLELKACLRPGGELVLETLIIDGPAEKVLVPKARYAQMRNVWFIPTIDTLLLWLARCEFKNARLVDVTPTTTAEQRSTEWMPFHSLQNFLDPHNPALTCEGLPAPKRALIIANR